MLVYVFATRFAPNPVVWTGMVFGMRIVLRLVHAVILTIIVVADLVSVVRGIYRRDRFWDWLKSNAYAWFMTAVLLLQISASANVR